MTLVLDLDRSLSSILDIPQSELEARSLFVERLEEPRPAIRWTWTAAASIRKHPDPAPLTAPPGSWRPWPPGVSFSGFGSSFREVAPQVNGIAPRAGTPRKYEVHGGSAGAHQPLEFTQSRFPRSNRSLIVVGVARVPAPGCSIS